MPVIRISSRIHDDHVKLAISPSLPIDVLWWHTEANMHDRSQYTPAHKETQNGTNGECMLGQRGAADSRGRLYKLLVVRIDLPVRHALLPSNINSAVLMTKKCLGHLAELLKLHKDVDILRQQCCDAPRNFWKLLDDDERLECFQQTRQDEVSRGLPAWNMSATAGISTNLFSLLDFATAQELYRQVHKLSFEFANDSGFAELAKELTEHSRFRECRDFFTDKRSDIQDGKLRIEKRSQDIDFLLKVFASMLPDMAATFIEQLFCLHQNLSLALEYITQHMADIKANNNGAESLEWQNKKESIWQLHIKEAVASACSDLENHRESFFPGANGTGSRHPRQDC